MAGTILDDAMPLPLPPARDIPATFVASIKSWYVTVAYISYLANLLHRWSAGEKESAASEERLLRCVSCLLSAKQWPTLDPYTGSCLIIALQDHRLPLCPVITLLWLIALV